MKKADWCQMWKALGLNLEAHDQLLNALSPIYQEVYLVKRVGVIEPLLFAGGVAKNPCIVELLKKKIKKEVIVLDEPQIVGAFGAAVYASGDKFR